MSGNSIKCSKCGHSNAITQMFCASCGGKLDLSNIKRGKIKKQRDGGGGLAGSIRALLRIALIAILVLLLWPVSPEGERGGRQLALSMNNKLESLRKAIAGNAQQTMVIEEAEANAYLASLTYGDEGSSGHLPVRDASLKFSGSRITVTVVAALGPLPVSYQITGIPNASNGFTFNITGARIGHMPLPGPGTRLVGGKIRTVFSGLTDERAVIGELDRIALGDGAVEVKVQ